MFDLTTRGGIQSSLESLKQGVRSTKTSFVEATTAVPQFGMKLTEKLIDTFSGIIKKSSDNLTTQDDQARAAIQIIETAKAAGAKSVKVKMSKDASVGFVAKIGGENVRVGVSNDEVVELEVSF